jgi:hypothetical protein
MLIVNCAAFLFLIALTEILIQANITVQSRDAILKTEFIYDQAPFPSCHASTIAETKDGLVAAWFGGTGERNPMLASGSRVAIRTGGPKWWKSQTAFSKTANDIPAGTRSCFTPRADRSCSSTQSGRAPASGGAC